MIFAFRYSFPLIDLISKWVYNCMFCFC